MFKKHCTPEKILSPQLHYYYKNKNNKTYRQKIMQRLNSIRAKCKKNGMACSISVDDLVLNTHCPVLGIELGYGFGYDCHPSIDRINNDLGYIPGNVRIISRKANRWKNNMTLDDLKLLIENWDTVSS